MVHSADRMAALSGVSAGRFLRKEEVEEVEEVEEADEEGCAMQAPQKV
jgi:hypothetical protein